MDVSQALISVDSDACYFDGVAIMLPQGELRTVGETEGLFLGSKTTVPAITSVFHPEETE
jgi:hypothetical protein